MDQVAQPLDGDTRIGPPAATPVPGRRLAVVLFNLGGPDRTESVRPFLVNLFTDPAILRVPGWIRPWLGRLIAWRRAPAATANYAILGGGSPLRELTEAQAAALETALGEAGVEARCFVAMRYWHPFAAEAVAAIRAWGAEDVLLLPLYPQFSTTTTGSSLLDWQAAATAGGLEAPTTTLCCWHSDAGFAAATARLVTEAYAAARATLPADVPLRILFSAHGLPESIVAAGDPYQWQVERSVAAVVRAMTQDGDAPPPDHVVCYQSRVTPQRWIAPSTELELERAAHDKVAVLVAPIAFVSEHSETLVELDVEYREEAERLGIPGYFRVPAQNSDPRFIAALRDLVLRTRDAAAARGGALCSWAGARQCPKQHGDCPHARAAVAARPRVTA